MCLKLLAFALGSVRKDTPPTPPADPQVSASSVVGGTQPKEIYYVPAVPSWSMCLWQ